MKPLHDPSRAFLAALRRTPALRAQERLLNTADRDLVFVMFPLTEEERSFVYALVSAAKAEKLRAELVRMRHVRLDAESVERVASHLIAHLAADRPLGPVSRYFKPGDPGRER
jgi:hypothetical protein